jgi:phosphoribosylaminoimidazolecarboxamide formyltransferase/IMP cyclohydrolase
MSAKVAQALLSVSDKTGLEDFARGLAARGVALLSTGGTAKALAAAGLAVTDVGAYTGFPEMLDGRVKTLHPKVHGGILARRDLPAHRDAIERAGIPTIDLVVVNLYPFRETVARDGCTLDDAIEHIDIGGPAMVRSAAKNWAHVGIVVDPSDYPVLLAELDAQGGALGEATRFRLAQKAFAHTAAYDGAIANWLTARGPDGAETGFPQSFRYAAELAQPLRYGENPHQRAAFYRDERPPLGSMATFRQLQGKELSYNNIADSDAAWECVKAFDAPACVIVKHANPCGVAIAATTLDAYRKAFATDPTSAFGGIIAFNRPVDAATVEAVAAQFLEVLIAPAYTADAIAAIVRKANVRVLEISLPESGVTENGVRPYFPGADAASWAADTGKVGSDPNFRKVESDPTFRDATFQLDFKRIGGGLLVQTADVRATTASDLKVVTRRAPTSAQVEDLLFAWRVAKHVKSNAIVYCAQGRTLGIGAGQMSRVDSTRIAAIKAQNAKLSLAGSVVASDAFFPFRDGLDVVADNGAVAVIQPGGSVRDEEVIAAADERGIAMVFTGVRHFRH